MRRRGNEGSGGVVVCVALWGSMSHSYSFRPSLGAYGGLLVMWDSSIVEVWTSCSMEHMLIIHDRFTHSNEDLYLICLIFMTLVIMGPSKICRTPYLFIFNG